MTPRILIFGVVLLSVLAAPALAQDNGGDNKLGGRIAPFVYIPTGTDFTGAGEFSFQPFFMFDDDYNLYGANLVFPGAGNGFYFPIAIADFDGGDDGVMFGLGFNRFFESGAVNGRWLGDLRVTHTTEVDCTSVTCGATHIWYTGGAITYLGGNVNAGFGDSDGFGYGGHGGIKFSMSDNIVLELQGSYRTFEGDGSGSLGASIGISF